MSDPEELNESHIAHAARNALMDAVFSLNGIVNGGDNEQKIKAAGLLLGIYLEVRPGPKTLADFFEEIAVDD